MFTLPLKRRYDTLLLYRYFIFAQPKMFFYELRNDIRSDLYTFCCKLSLFRYGRSTLPQVLRGSTKRDEQIIIFCLIGELDSRQIMCIVSMTANDIKSHLQYKQAS
jgi:hypothetical protein